MVKLIKLTNSEETMNKLLYVGALSTILLVGCGEAEAPIPELKEIEYPKLNNDESEQSKENKDVTYYETETKPFIDEFLNKYDSTWNNIWVITMDRASNNDISTEDAHAQIKKVHDAYRDLSIDSKIPNQKLSKNHKKLAKEIIENLNLSAVNRQTAAKIAMEILETNSDAKINEMNEKIEWSNDFMSKAQSALVELESSLYN